jgi:hypothetical protein
MGKGTGGSDPLRGGAAAPRDSWRPSRRKPGIAPARPLTPRHAHFATRHLYKVFHLFQFRVWREIKRPESPGEYRFREGVPILGPFWIKMTHHRAPKMSWFHSDLKVSKREVCANERSHSSVSRGRVPGNVGNRLHADASGHTDIMSAARCPRPSPGHPVCGSRPFVPLQVAPHDSKNKPTVFFLCCYNNRRRPKNDVERVPL